MRLRTIRTVGLFGVFDHVIHLKMDDRITIIHGPNGYGKTAILRLISDIFESRHTAVRELPFESIDLGFDDDSSLVVRKEDSDDEGSRRRIVYECPPHDPFVLPDQTIPDTLLSSIDDYIPALSRVGHDEWFYHPTGENLNLDEVLDRFGSHLRPEFVVVSYPDWLAALRDSLDVHFIRATRLESSRVSQRMARRWCQI